VGFSPGGKWIASASFDQIVAVWDVARGQPVQTIRGAGKMSAAVFSADDGLLATAGWDGKVTLWDTRTWQPVGIIPGNGQMVTTISFSPAGGGLLASGGYDNEVRVWNTTTLALVRTFSGHTGAIWAVGFSPDGKSLSSASAEDLANARTRCAIFAIAIPEAIGVTADISSKGPIGRSMPRSGPGRARFAVPDNTALFRDPCPTGP
jgi:WD40 repeat protein